MQFMRATGLLAVLLGLGAGCRNEATNSKMRKEAASSEAKYKGEWLYRDVASTRVFKTQSLWEPGDSGGKEGQGAKIELVQEWAIDEAQDKPKLEIKFLGHVQGKDRFAVTVEYTKVIPGSDLKGGLKIPLEVTYDGTPTTVKVSKKGELTIQPPAP